MLNTINVGAAPGSWAAAALESHSVLVVADEPEVTNKLVAALELSGYAVSRVRTGQQAEDAVRNDRPDLVVLDVILPDADGLLVLSNLRVSHAPVRTIVVGRGQRRSDVVLALRLGADDFITAPFNVNEFRARVDAVLRRIPAGEVHPPPSGQPPTPAPEMQFEDLVIDSTTGQASVGGMSLHLTPIEHALLTALVQQPDHSLSRQDLIARVWGKNGDRRSRSLDVHIGRLRAKLRGARVGGPSLVSARVHTFKLVPADADPAGRPMTGLDDAL
jgi:DNA-binding response OmpR family regulator